jgi:hypothetical protein
MQPPPDRPEPPMRHAKKPAPKDFPPEAFGI